MNPCELPPCPPCPPPPPKPCPQYAPEVPPPPPCHSKPVMRGLHWAQTKRHIAVALTLSASAGFLFYIFVARPRRERYRDFYAKAELDDWGDEMARKGLFQAVPKESLKDNTHMKAK